MNQETQDVGSTEPPSQPPIDQPINPQINTDGGAVFAQNIDTDGGDVIGRDQKITIHGNEKTAKQILARAGRAVIGRDQSITVRIGKLQVPLWLALWVGACAVVGVTVIGWFAWRNTPELVKMSGRLRIAIADFGATDERGKIQESSVGAELSNWVARVLERELPKSDDGILAFEIWQDDLNRPPSNPPFNTIRTAEEALQLLHEENINADLVAFGYLDRPSAPSNLTLEFVYKDRQVATEPDGDVGRQRMGGVIPIPARYKEALQRGDELFVRSQAIVGLSRGLAQEFAGNYQGAFDLYQVLDQNLPIETWPKGRGREVLYFFTGRTAFQMRQLETAETYFNRAKDLRDDYVSAYIGLGNVNFERAQLRLLLDQKADDASLATCGGNKLQSYITTALQHEQIPATVTETITVTTRAIASYQQAVDASASFEWPPAQHITRYMLANGLRLRGDIYWLTNQYDNAKADLTFAQQGFAAEIEPLSAAQELGYVAYSWYKLGLTSRTLARIARDQGENDAAIAAFSTAEANFARCQEFADKSDSSGDTQYQSNAACYCNWWQKQVQEERKDVPQEEKGSVG